MAKSFFVKRYGHLPEFLVGQQVARRDIEAGKLTLHLYGDFNPAFQNFSELLRERHDLNLEWEYRGEFGLDAWVAGYDEEMHKELTRRLGEGTQENLWREAEKNLK